MTDPEAQRALLALAGAPCPWAVPGARCRLRVLGDYPADGAGVVYARAGDTVSVRWDDGKFNDFDLRMFVDPDGTMGLYPGPGPAL